MRKGVVAGLVVGALVVVGGGAGAWWYLDGKAQREADAAAEAAVTALADGWKAGDVSGVGFSDPAVGESFATATAGLGVKASAVEAGDVTRDGDTATSTLAVTWSLPGDVEWSYTVPVTVKAPESGNRWVVTPAGADVSPWAPGLQSGQVMKVQRTTGERGDLLDRDGAALMPLGTVYPVQIDPTRATPAVAAALEKLVDEKPGTLVAKLAAAKKSASKAPIAVVTYRQADFDARRAQLDALTGVVYPKTTQPLASTRTFGQPLLGSYGEVTAEMVKDGKGRYVAGDRAGTSGLQRQYDAVLAGSAGVEVVTDSGKTLFEKAAVDGKDVQTTLSPTIQAAAEAAAATTGAVPSAVVAVDKATGDVLASANNPAFGFDRALTGQFPPGSAFKVATTYALLTKGEVKMSTPVACPTTITVDGRAYKNFAGEGASGTPTFAQDFATSCNTAFISLAPKLTDTDLKTAAAALGVGTGWGDALGVQDGYAGSVPENDGATDKASAMIGQGRNLVSPVALASMAANVARGSTIQPALVTDPAPEGVDRKAAPLDAGSVATLRGLMRAVVTRGSGTALNNVPGGPVFGKSGTAEFGNASPPETHAWFIGWQGDVAFAVIVDQGRSGGTVAAPVAKAFLAGLQG